MMKKYNAIMDGNPVRIEVAYDPDPSDPISYWEDSAPIIICAHRRYNLGTPDAIDRLKSLIRSSSLYKDGWEEPYRRTPSKGWYDNKSYLDLDDHEDIIKAAERIGSLIAPVYMYEHGGIAVSLTKFSDMWDSGLLGFVVWTREQREKFHRKTFRDTKKRRDEDMTILRSYFSEWSTYVAGDVYVVDVLSETGECVESIGGIDGDEPGPETFEEYFGIDPASVTEIAA
jgi:hypothetical protein